MRKRVASAGAIVAGFGATAVGSVAVDALMHFTGLFPATAQTMTTWEFALAAVYRVLFTIAGGYVTGRLAPDLPMRHVWILGGIGTLAGLAGVMFQFLSAPGSMGPKWYAISIPMTALPGVWMGGRFALYRRTPGRHPSSRSGDSTRTI